MELYFRYFSCIDTQKEFVGKPAGVFSPKLSRILPQKDAVSPSPAWLKKIEPTVIQNPMTIRRFFIIVIEKYLATFPPYRVDARPTTPTLTATFPSYRVDARPTTPTLAATFSTYREDSHPTTPTLTATFPPYRVDARPTTPTLTATV
ncbi:hypothetical protein AVEN_159926-1 [Araneus ventricosus]|uniref:Uncharacterized protein n=1 Tax=Araneus ventricosus TaxID=182803 RepID=A0A4Y2SDM2_ARAVE|nr:hypothetical protein AVEN_159926-1 [Araneus ventricosus]